MSEKAKGGGEQEGGHGIGLWYVSFADMTTLLLSFFVMLATFSSYNKESLDKFAGAWAYMENYSVFSNKRVLNSFVTPADRVTDWTTEGSEKPTDQEPVSLRRPKETPYDEDSIKAYSDRRVFYVPSTRLFWGKGSSLVPAGREHLKRIASFMKMVPCHVVISESNPADQAEGAAGRSLERAWALVEFFTQQGGIPADRFSIAAPASPAEEGRTDKAAAVEIVLAARSVYK